MREWKVTGPYYGMADEALQNALNLLEAEGWRVFQILQPERVIVAYRDKKGKK
jgi:hypothetical protein